MNQYGKVLHQIIQFCLCNKVSVLEIVLLLSQVDTNCPMFSREVYEMRK